MNIDLTYTFHVGSTPVSFLEINNGEYFCYCRAFEYCSEKSDYTDFKWYNKLNANFYYTSLPLGVKVRIDENYKASKIFYKLKIEYKQQNHPHAYDVVLGGVK